MQLLPGLSAQAGYAWEPNALLGFGNAVLTWIAQQARQHAGQQLLITYSHVARRLECNVVEGDLPQRLQRLLPMEG